MKIEVKPYRGRTLVWIDGQPRNLTMYSPPAMGRVDFAPVWRGCVDRFVRHDMDVYLMSVPQQWEKKFTLNPFWAGDTITSDPMYIGSTKLDEGPEYVLAKDPEALLLLRYVPRPPQDWYPLHQDECVVGADGKRENYPSLASPSYRRQAGELCAAYIHYCESRPWAERLLGYINYHLCEGTHGPLSGGWLYDYSPAMTARWRQYLCDKYGDDSTLREAHGDPNLSLETVEVPRDPLLGPLREVAAIPYWQDAVANQARRDYLLLTRDLYHDLLRAICIASHAASPAERLHIHDTFKLPMQGWSNHGFFSMDQPWPIIYAENLSGSGNMDVLDLLDTPGLDGVCTPYDYQVRGAGGVFEPEGIADSVSLLPNKLFLVEQDIRTYAGDVHNCGMMRDLNEFEAVTWRDLATSITRGFMNYLTDHNADYYCDPAMHPIVERQMRVLSASAQWPHATVPGIAMILDEQAILETSGSGHILNEAVMWEEKIGISRCGVPYRIYLLDDLRAGHVPDHAVYYFPNLYRVDEARLELLRRTVLRDGRLVVWGPGSGISDGRTIAAEHATRLTGFQFSFQTANYPRRVQISDFTHPITSDLQADTIYGSPIAYGPILYPTDGIPLGWAWSKFGGDDVGLAYRESDSYRAVFTTAAPLPACLWRSLARFAGAHIWCESNDVLMADSSLVALHTLKAETKLLALPGDYRVTDLLTGQKIADRTREISFTMHAPATAVFQLEQV